MKFFNRKTDTPVFSDSDRPDNIPSYIASSINSHLKPLGFKKQGQSFYKEVNDITQIVNLRGSYYNTVKDGMFYVNLAIFSSKIYEIENGEPAPKTPHEYNGQLRMPIGPDKAGGGKWWDYNESTSISQLGEDIGSFIAQYVPDYFAPLDSLKSISEYQNDPKANSVHFQTSYGNITQAIVAGLLGDKDTALDKLLTYIQKNDRITTNIKCRVKAMAHDLGVSLVLPETENLVCVGFYIPMKSTLPVKDERRTVNKVDLYLRNMESKELGFKYHRGICRKNGYYRIAFVTQKPNEIVEYMTVRQDKLPLHVMIERNDRF